MRSVLWKEISGSRGKTAERVLSLKSDDGTDYCGSPGGTANTPTRADKVRLFQAESA